MVESRKHQKEPQDNTHKINKKARLGTDKQNH